MVAVSIVQAPPFGEKSQTQLRAEVAIRWIVDLAKQEVPPQIG